MGKLNNNYSLLEIIPLPYKSVKNKDWFYDIFGLDYLETRKKYLDKVMSLRIKLFKNLINKHHPKIIIFYSFTYLHKWKEIIECDLKNKGSFYYCKNKGIDYFVIPNPTAHGMTNSEWKDITLRIKKLSKI